MKTTEIEIARTIPAPAADVFDVWLDPKSPGGPWFGAERVILNPVVNTFRFALARLISPQICRGDRHQVGSGEISPRRFL